MFNNWFRKEKPIQGLMGMGGGATGNLVGGGGGSVDVEIHMYGGKSNIGGRGGDSPYGGWTTISGTATSGTTIAYICGKSVGTQAFYDGGPGGGGGRRGGGFTAVWVGGGNIAPVARDSNYILGVAGGSGAGGDDGYNDNRGGYGGGTNGGDCPEQPDQNLRGRGATQSSGGAGGGGGGTGQPWYGGNGYPSPEQVGGGGGGWYGGGGGGSNGGYDSGGGGGSGYTGSTPRTLDNPYGKFVVTGGQTSPGGYPGPGAPGPVGSGYPHTGQSHPANVGRVYIIVDGVEVHDGRANPGSAASTYTIP